MKQITIEELEDFKATGEPRLMNLGGYFHPCDKAYSDAFKREI